MTLPSSGQILMTDLVNEFGGSAPYLLQNYYAGGALVPSGTVSPVSGPVPTSGTISLYNFYGTQNWLELITMNVGTGGGAFPLRGYSDPSSFNFGALSNNSFFAGGTITDLWWNPSTNDIAFILDFAGGADPGQFCFTYLDINGNLYYTSDAIYDASGQLGTWEWHGVGDPFPGDGSNIGVGWR